MEKPQKPKTKQERFETFLKENPDSLILIAYKQNMFTSDIDTTIIKPKQYVNDKFEQPKANEYNIDRIVSWRLCSCCWMENLKMWPFDRLFKKDTRTSIEIARELAKEENRLELKKIVKELLTTINYHAAHGTSSYTSYDHAYDTKNCTDRLFQLAKVLTEKPHSFEVAVCSDASADSGGANGLQISQQYIVIKFGKDAVPGKLTLCGNTKKLLGINESVSTPGMTT